MPSLSDLRNDQIALLFPTKDDCNIRIPRHVLIKVYNQMVLYQKDKSEYTIDEITAGVQKAIASKYAQEILNCFHNANDAGIENPEIITSYLLAVDFLMNRKKEIETYLPDAVYSLSMYLCTHTNNKGPFTLEDISVKPDDLYPSTIEVLNTIGNGASSGAVHATF